MSYSRCFSTLGCPAATLDAVAALAACHGIRAVELRGLEDTLDLPTLWETGGSTPAALAARVHTLGLDVVALDTSFALGAATEEARQELRRFVPWAEALGVRWLRVFDGAAGPGAVAAVAWWRELRQREGWHVDLLVETHDSLLTGAAVTAFQAALPGGPVALLWDSHHTWRRGGEAPAETWRAVRPWVAHIHVKDSVATPGAGGCRYVLPGRGEFPMAELRSALASDYRGALSLEWERRWHPDLPPLEEALAAAVGWW